MAFVHNTDLHARKNRGPLRALHNNVAVDSDTVSTPKNNRADQVKLSKCENAYISEIYCTPVLRASHQQSLDRRRSWQNTFPLPLRTSSCRASKSFKTGGMSSTEDIRHHFRVRGISNLNLSSKSTMDGNASTSLMSGHTTHFDGSSSSASNKAVATKRRGSEIVDEPTVASKQMRYSDSTCADTDTKPVHMTMGAIVKAHPRYYRRHSGAEPPEVQSHAVSLQRRLSPVCPVPMPSSFPSLMPATYTAVSLPWEVARSPAPQRTVQTQTTPPSNVPQSAEDTHSRSLRQSFGSSHVLNSLKRTFGNLRRAMSAERLHRSTNGSGNKSCSASAVHNNIPTAFCVSPVSSKLRFRRIGSKRLGIARRSRRQSTCSAPQTDSLPSEEDQSGSVNPCNDICFSSSEDVPSAADPVESLTYHVLGAYSDGSVRLQLRRKSINCQFGFFIARDSQGVYISRLGSVRCTVKLWNVLHVGDRILEVQGVPCSKLEVEEVQNLIRGCELVEFRVQSAGKRR